MTLPRTIEAELDRLGLPQPKPAKPAPIPRNDTFRHYEGDF